MGIQMVIESWKNSQIVLSIINYQAPGNLSGAKVKYQINFG